MGQDLGTHPVLDAGDVDDGRPRVGAESTQDDGGRHVGRQASYIPFLETRTDNVEERPNGVHSRLNEAMFFWEDYDQEDLDTPLNYWNACYKGIAQANKALELLSTYPKSARVKALYDITDNDKKA